MWILVVPFFGDTLLLMFISCLLLKGDHEDLPFSKFCSVALAYQVNMGPKDILNTLLLTCLAL